MIQQKGCLFVFTGPSGVGKGTLLKRVMEQEDNLFLSISATTRAPRPEDADGVTYYFLTRDQFEQKIEAGEFLEHAWYSGNYYGTPLAPIEEHLSRGEDVILEIEVQGAMQIRAKRPDAAMIFVAPPDADELESRLRGRNTEDEETIRKRLTIAREELAQTANFDYLIVNDEVDRAVQELRAVLQAERARTAHRRFEV
ncbi:MAG: guanylate kinase [Butyricicoccus sp.]